jgi:hypothetical protein
VGVRGYGVVTPRTAVLLVGTALTAVVLWFLLPDTGGAADAIALLLSVAVVWLFTLVIGFLVIVEADIAGVALRKARGAPPPAGWVRAIVLRRLLSFWGGR